MLPYGFGQVFAEPYAVQLAGVDALYDVFAAILGIVQEIPLITPQD